MGDVLYSDEEREDGYLDRENPDDLALAERDRVMQRQAEFNELRHVLRSKLGRRFIRRLIYRTGFILPSMDSDERRTAFNEGQRDIGKWIIDEFQAVAATKEDDRAAFESLITSIWSEEK